MNTSASRVQGVLGKDYRAYASVQIASMSVVQSFITDAWSMTTSISKNRINLEGNDEVYTIDNPLITNDYLITARDYLAKYIPFSNYEGWLIKQTYIDCDFRIDPRLELFDKVKVVDKSGNQHFGIVEALTIKFDGAFTGKATIREFDNGLKKPIVYGLFISYPNWGFMVYNPNEMDLTLVISYSATETTTIVIPANDGVFIDDGTGYVADALNESFYEKSIGSLVEDVICYWQEKPELGTTIILESDY